MPKFSQVPTNNSPAIADFLLGVSTGNVDQKTTIAALAALISANLNYAVVTGYQSYTERLTDFSVALTGAASWLAVSGFGPITVVADGKRRIRVKIQVPEAWRGAGGIFLLGIWEGTVGSGTLRALTQTNATSGATSTQTPHVEYVSSTVPAAGTYTFNFGVAGAAGQTGTLSVANLKFWALGELF